MSPIAELMSEIVNVLYEGVLIVSSSMRKSALERINFAKSSLLPAFSIIAFCIITVAYGSPTVYGPRLTVLTGELNGWVSGVIVGMD